MKPATGTGTEERLLQAPDSGSATDWSRDGRFVLYRHASDIWALPIHKDRKPFPVARAESEQRDAIFAPDGKWIAYQSDESGRLEVYVQPFPGPGSKSQISSNGGGMHRWRDDGRELFYIGLDGQLMAVPIRFDTNTITAGTPVPLFATRVGGVHQANSMAQYVVSPDGQRFLMNTLAEEAASPITVILNWKARP